MQDNGMEASEATAWLESKARIKTRALNFIKVPGRKSKESFKITRLGNWRKMQRLRRYMSKVG